jgi:hypothetical protein
VKLKESSNLLEGEAQGLPPANKRQIDQRALVEDAISRRGPGARRKQSDAFVVPQRGARQSGPLGERSDIQRHAHVLHLKPDFKLKALTFHSGAASKIFQRPRIGRAS